MLLAPIGSIIASPSESPFHRGLPPSPSRRPMPSHHQWQTPCLGNTKKQTQAVFKESNGVWVTFFWCGIGIYGHPQKIWSYHVFKVIVDSFVLFWRVGIGSLWRVLRLIEMGPTAHFFWKFFRKKNDHCHWPMESEQFQRYRWEKQSHFGLSKVGQTSSLQLSEVWGASLNQPTQPTTQPTTTELMDFRRNVWLSSLVSPLWCMRACLPWSVSVKSSATLPLQNAGRYTP